MPQTKIGSGFVATGAVGPTSLSTGAPYWDTSGNVGVGTTSPQSKLDVRGNMYLGPSGFILGSLPGTTIGSMNICAGPAFNAGGASIVARGTTNGYNNGGIEFYTGAGAAGAEVMRIDSSGNVGIGTSSPSQKLDVRGGNGTGGISGSGGTWAAQIIMNQDTPGYGGLSVQNRFANTNTAVFEVAAGWNGSTSGYNPVFTINGEGGCIWKRNTGAESARIDTSGTLMVGTTSNDPIGAKVSGGIINASGQAQFNANGARAAAFGRYTSTGELIQFFYHNGSSLVGTGNISTNGTTTSYNTSSDYRLKENVQPITTGLSKISALKPVTYEWISDKSEGEGFIAHELQSVIPLAVTGGKDAVDDDGKIIPQGVDYSKIVVHLVAAIQELTAKVTALEAKVGP